MVSLAYAHQGFGVADCVAKVGLFVSFFNVSVSGSFANITVRFEPGVTE